MLELLQKAECKPGDQYFEEDREDIGKDIELGERKVLLQLRGYEYTEDDKKCQRKVRCLQLGLAFLHICEALQ